MSALTDPAVLGLAVSFASWIGGGIACLLWIRNDPRRRR
jgi:hypothetical protein